MEKCPFHPKGPCTWISFSLALQAALAGPSSCCHELMLSQDLKNKRFVTSISFAICWQLQKTSFYDPFVSTLLPTKSTHTLETRCVVTCQHHADTVIQNNPEIQWPVTQSTQNVLKIQRRLAQNSLKAQDLNPIQYVETLNPYIFMA